MNQSNPLWYLWYLLCCCHQFMNWYGIYLTPLNMKLAPDAVPMWRSFKVKWQQLSWYLEMGCRGRYPLAWSLTFHRRPNLWITTSSTGSTTEVVLCSGGSERFVLEVFGSGNAGRAEVVLWHLGGNRWADHGLVAMVYHPWPWPEWWNVGLETLCLNHPHNLWDHFCRTPGCKCNVCSH